MPPPSRKPITRAITPGKTATSVPDLTHTAKTKAGEALALLPTYQTRVEALVVESDEDYELADALLGQINDLRKGWDGIWKHVQEKAIKPIRQGLEVLYGLDRSVDKPLESLAQGVRAKMTEWTRRKLRAEQERDRAEQELQAQLAAQAEEKRQQAITAATPQMRGRLEAQAERLDEQAQSVATFDLPPLTPAAAHSVPRTVKVVTLDLPMFLVGIIEGTIPQSILPLDDIKAAVMRTWKQDPDEVATWHGVSIEDDINVVSK